MTAVEDVADADLGEPEPDWSTLPGWQDFDSDQYMDPSARTSKRTRLVIEWMLVVVAALAMALVVRNFMFPSFEIKSGSMLPTLQVGDRVLVNKIAFDADDLKHGDIVVFHPPSDVDLDLEHDLIKRVIAVAGQRVETRNGQVWVDGSPLDEPYLLPGLPTDNLRTLTVPAGRVFVMGDNRANSLDSRVYGPIREQDIVGRAVLRVWPVQDLGTL